MFWGESFFFSLLIWCIFFSTKTAFLNFHNFKIQKIMRSLFQNQAHLDWTKVRVDHFLIDPLTKKEFTDRFHYSLLTIRCFTNIINFGDIIFPPPFNKNKVKLWLYCNLGQFPNWAEQYLIWVGLRLGLGCVTSSVWLNS